MGFALASGEKRTRATTSEAHRRAKGADQRGSNCESGLTKNWMETGPSGLGSLPQAGVARVIQEPIITALLYLCSR